MIGHTTPEDLHAHLADVDAANGLMNRFLFVLTTRERLLPVPARVARARARYAGGPRAPGA